MNGYHGASDFDVVVVGGGPAGLAAAVTASELGLRSMLIEKTSRLGGQLHASAGRFSAAGTRLQRQRGIDDSPDRHFRDIMRLGHGRADPDLLRLAVTVAPEAVDWLDALGFPFHPDAPSLVTYHETYSRPRTYWGESGGSPGGRPSMSFSQAGDSSTKSRFTLRRVSHRCASNAVPMARWSAVSNSRG